MTPEQIKNLKRKYGFHSIEPLNLNTVESLLGGGIAGLVSHDLADCFSLVRTSLSFAVIRNGDTSEMCERMAADLRASGVRTGKIVDGEIRWD